MGRVVLVITLAASVASIGCSRDPEKASRQYIASGDEFARQGKLKEAAIEYRNAIKRKPQSIDAHAKLADVSARANDAPTAIGEVLRLAELKPDDVAAQVKAGSVYLLAGRFADARARAESALRIDATDAGAHILLGQALAGLHDPKRSEASFRDAVRLAPASIDAHVALGSYLWSSNRTKEAEGELTRAVELDTTNAAANRALALFYMSTDRTADAEPLWTVVARSPNGDPFALADFHSAQGHLREAETELRPLVARRDLSDAARLRLAGVQYALGERSAAHETLNAVIAQNPSLLGLGVDEDTAGVVGPDHILEVIGRGSITVVDGSTSETDAWEIKGHRPLMISGVILHSLPSGYRFDLRHRHRIATPALHALQGGAGGAAASS